MPPPPPLLISLLLTAHVEGGEMQDAVAMALQMIDSIPLPDIMAFRKVCLYKGLWSRASLYFTSPSGAVDLVVRLS